MIGEFDYHRGCVHRAAIIAFTDDDADNQMNKLVSCLTHFTASAQSLLLFLLLSLLRLVLVDHLAFC